MSQFAPEYVSQKAVCPEQRFALKSGRMMGYLAQCEGGGSLGATKTVLCIHGLLSSKLMWLLPQPLPGYQLLAIDRMGHGASSD